MLKSHEDTLPGFQPKYLAKRSKLGDNIFSLIHLASIHIVLKTLPDNFQLVAFTHASIQQKPWLINQSGILLVKLY